ncbi:NADH-quinone oxidoreductase subunit M, partial [bacterium]|nr:NADH-quinone oxidoreductase subunit M [bacterium]
LFPQAALDFAPIAMSLAIVGIIYGAVLAFAQTDLKRLVAYTSVSHMGFVFLGIFAFNIWGMQGVVLQMVCHGLSTGALFVLVGQIYERTHTRDMNKLGGLWETAPRLAALGLVFAMASLGLPGMGNFLAEMLVLIGAYKANLIVTVIAATGLVAATIYSLWIVQKTFHGPNDKKWRIPDLNLREMLIMLTMVLGLLWLGLYPRPILKTTEAVAQKLADIPFLLPHEPDLPVLATEHAPADSAQNSAKLIQSKLEETL